VAKHGEISRSRGQGELAESQSKTVPSRAPFPFGGSEALFSVVILTD
jgi:hypothetical protein